MEASISIAGILAPIGLYYVRHCLQKIRDPLNVKKSLLLLPTKGGKTTLKNKLKNNSSNLLVIDVDEFLETISKPEEIKQLWKYKVGTDNLNEYDLFYRIKAEEIFKMIKEQMKNNRKLRVLFLSSCVAFKELFKPDSVYVACPDKEFFEEIVKDLPPESDKEQRIKREYFLAQFEDKKVINLYHSYQELETMVRERFKLKFNL